VAASKGSGSASEGRATEGSSEAKRRTVSGSRHLGRQVVKEEPHGPRLHAPLVGEITLPPVEHLAWYGVLGVLAVGELIEWPLALLLGIGKLLADNRHSVTLQNIGDALEQAA
jgi:hypothetical protein